MQKKMRVSLTSHLLVKVEIVPTNDLVFKKNLNRPSFLSGTEENFEYENKKYTIYFYENGESWVVNVESEDKTYSCGAAIPMVSSDEELL